MIHKLENATHAYTPADRGPGNHPISPDLSDDLKVNRYIEQILRYGEIDVVKRVANILKVSDDGGTDIPILKETLESWKDEVSLHMQIISERPNKYYSWRYYRYPDIHLEKNERGYGRPRPRGNEYNF